MFKRICPEVPDEWYTFDSTEAGVIGFSDDLFYGHFTRTGNSLMIHYIYSRKPGEGNVQNLITELKVKGWDVVIVNPCLEMQHICNKFGFTGEMEEVEGYYRGKEVAVWKNRSGVV
jgi:hypothetical protein